MSSPDPVHITFVKKILATGEPCQKCNDVAQRLEQSGQLARIDETLIADERDPNSPGMLLARELDVDRAPFFVVDSGNGQKEVYTVYFKFAKEVLGKETSTLNQGREILNDNPDLDFI
ncbi:MAG: hypothetical protein ABGY96_29550 [bacterium]